MLHDAAAAAVGALSLQLLRCEQASERAAASSASVTGEDGSAPKGRWRSMLRVCMGFMGSVCAVAPVWLSKAPLGAAVAAGEGGADRTAPAALAAGAQGAFRSAVLQLLGQRPLRTRISNEVIPSIIFSAGAGSLFLLGEHVLPAVSGGGVCTLAQAAHRKATREMLLMPRTGACMLGQHGAVSVLVGAAVSLYIVEAAVNVVPCS